MNTARRVRAQNEKNREGRAIKNTGDRGKNE